jgi:hypothetical protein
MEAMCFSETWILRRATQHHIAEEILLIYYFLTHWEDRNVDEWITLRWILMRLGAVMWTGLVWFRIWTNGELF